MSIRHWVHALRVFVALLMYPREMRDAMRDATLAWFDAEILRVRRQAELARLRTRAAQVSAELTANLRKNGTLDEATFVEFDDRDLIDRL